MSAMVASSLKLNPDAPLFVPAAIQQVEDFSPQWWDLVKSTAWFREHWYHEHQQLDDMADSLNAFETADHDDDDFNGLLLPDAIDDDDQDGLFYGNTTSTTPQAARPTVTLTTGTLRTTPTILTRFTPHITLNKNAVLKALVSPKGGDAPKGFPEKPRYTEKATKYAGSPSPRGGAAPRFIHQPRG
ncbi:protein EARLY RESPONSIVE TO DEHYDRATION 15-like [Lolium rigidum]|uniref:protein EARLY RESPONSIVE TO DEHYDRATION 15-like n=1 Tax=Lolium rigidum TaxID=89674 RepID=UPI001F5C584A|nr:protein EARLY RESPONSIVE TO DEHYDRATION 15-like [Lolium rigidum]XP_047084393.1 protein EARLY RESPONSIVE TO DEHYDRATION 15-like [Lolium rigidum]